MDKEEPYTAGVTDVAAKEISMETKTEERPYGPVTLPMERTTKPWGCSQLQVRKTTGQGTAVKW